MKETAMQLPPHCQEKPQETIISYLVVFRYKWFDS